MKEKRQRGNNRFRPAHLAHELPAEGEEGVQEVSIPLVAAGSAGDTDGGSSKNIFEQVCYFCWPRASFVWCL